MNYLWIPLPGNVCFQNRINVSESEISSFSCKVPFVFVLFSNISANFRETSLQLCICLVSIAGYQWRVQDFPQGGVNSQSECANLFLPKTAWKLKNLDPLGHTSLAPPGSPNGVQILLYRSTAPLYLRMLTREGCRLRPHVLTHI